MTAEEIIEQLERLIDDREAFIRAYAPDRNVFVRDKEALEEVVKILQLIADNKHLHIHRIRRRWRYVGDGRQSGNLPVKHGTEIGGVTGCG